MVFKQCLVPLAISVPGEKVSAVSVGWFFAVFWRDSEPVVFEYSRSELNVKKKLQILPPI
jgi:hypothetical protein